MGKLELHKQHSGPVRLSQGSIHISIANIITSDKTENGTTTFLLFNGLDTVTSIYLCQQHVADTNNQFRQYFFDVTSILSKCTSLMPQLQLRFFSAPSTANTTAAQSGQETWPWGVQNTFEFNNRWFIRKQQSDFGWDWGPAFAPAGPWQKAWIVQLAAQEVFVRNSVYDIYRLGQLNNLPPSQGADWVFNASIDVLNTVPKGTTMRYQIVDLEANRTVAAGNLVNVTNAGDVITGSAILGGSDYKLWWPNGLGSQNLYNITVDIVSSSNQVLASITKRTGFRTIVLNMGPITQSQLSQGIAPGNNCRWSSITQSKN
jgi:beta-mannosidase